MRLVSKFLGIILLSFVVLISACNTDDKLSNQKDEMISYVDSEINTLETSLIEKINESLDKINELEEKYEEKTLELENVDKEIASKTEEHSVSISALEEDLNDVKIDYMSRISELNTKFNELEKDILSLETEIEELKDEYEVNKNELLNKINETNDKLSSLEESNNEEFDKINNELTKLNNNLLTLENSYKEADNLLKEEYTSLNNELKNVDNQIKEVNEEQNKNIKEIEENISTLESKHTKEINELINSKNEIISELEEIKGSIEILNTTLLKEIDDVKDELKDLEDKLDNEDKKLQGEINKLNDLTNSLSTLIESNNGKIADLEDELEELKGQICNEHILGEWILVETLDDRTNVYVQKCEKCSTVIDFKIEKFETEYDYSYDKHIHYVINEDGTYSHVENHTFLNGYCIECGVHDSITEIIFTLINNDQEYCVTSITGSAKIPSEYNGLPVTSIELYSVSFSANVYIPSSVVNFNGNITNGNFYLESKILPKNYNEIFSKNCNLYLGYSEGKNKITLISNDYNNFTFGTYVLYGDEMIKLPIPTKEGYIFKGYYDSLVDGKQYYDENMNSVRNWDKNEDAELYARWESEVYFIEFNANGGNGEMDPMTVSYDDAYYNLTPISMNTFELEGYIFKGWSLYEDGESMYLDESSVYEIIYDYKPENKEKIIIYAVWEEKLSFPKAWEDGETFLAKECSISLVPGSIENPDAKPVKDYLNADNVRFFDLRDASEGYGIGHIQGFESVSYFKVIVGEGHLFTKTDTGFIANYKESEQIIKDIFPMDAKLFFMCQAGGRVPQLLTLLNQLGYNMDNVYNVGGWNHIKDLEDFGGYEVSLGIGASSIEYDFSALTPVTAPAAVRKAAAPKMPVAWEEGETYQAKDCSISLVPGSIANPDARPVLDYLTTENVRFFDLRDVREGYGVGHIQKFETVSYFNTIVGEGHLFTKTDTGFIANYKESEQIIKDIFPMDAKLFIMCQSGGRVQPFLTLLAQLGYNMDNVYNVGGWNHIKDLQNFDGYEVSLGIGASSIEYDFSNLTRVDYDVSVSPYSLYVNGELRADLALNAEETDSSKDVYMMTLDLKKGDQVQIVEGGNAVNTWWENPSKDSDTYVATVDGSHTFYFKNYTKSGGGTCVWVSIPAGGNSETPTGEKIRVYFAKPSNWGSNINVYTWDSTGPTNGNWPGTKIQYDSVSGYYYVDDITTGTNIIFNDGFNDSFNQTTDLVVPVNGNNLFNGSTWVHFDSSSNVLNGAGFGGLH